jgi:hypothetical protein
MPEPIDIEPIPSPIPSGINTGSAEPEGVTAAPSIFFVDQDDAPVPGTQLNEPLPRAWSEGGVIEAAKRAIVMGVRDAFEQSTMGSVMGTGEKFNVDIEYPTDITEFPGVWVQFQISKLTRAGIGMETWVQTDGNWSAIVQWIFEGSITLACAALSSKDRDRLADTVIAQLAFSRPPNPVITNPAKDAKQFRGLITSLNNNPYIAITLNNDMINGGGQTVSGGTPWAQNILLYEDNYTVTCQGQFNMEFDYDGVYSLRAIDVIPTISATGQVLDPTPWLGTRPEPMM